MRILSLLFVLSLSTTAVYGQRHHVRDTVTAIRTTDGSNFFGTIERETSDSIFFRTSDGVMIQLPRSNVTAIDYKALKPARHWSEFGGVLGTPAGLNFVVGAHWPSIGIRLSGAYWGHALSGVQIGVPINLYRSENASHDIAIVGGTSLVELQKQYIDSYGFPYTSPEDYYWTAAGVAYDLNLSGFSLELGLSVGSGSFSNPQLLLQIGYVYQNK